MLQYAAHHRWVTLVIRNPLGLCCISHIGCGDHPPDFMILGQILCGAWPAPAREGRQGAEAAPVSSGITVPLSRTKNNLIRLLGVAEPAAHHCFFLRPPSSTPTESVGNQRTYPLVEDPLLKRRTRMYTRKYQSAYPFNPMLHPSLQMVLVEQ